MRLNPISKCAFAVALGFLLAGCSSSLLSQGAPTASLKVNCTLPSGSTETAWMRGAADRVTVSSAFELVAVPATFVMTTEYMPASLVCTPARV